MSKATGNKPRHKPDGKYEHVCLYCQVTYRDNHKLSSYCCFAHKQKQSNNNFYRQHRKEIILSVMLRRSRNFSKQSSDKSKTFDEMSSDELIEFIQKNPHLVRGR